MPTTDTTTLFQKFCAMGMSSETRTKFCRVGFLARMSAKTKLTPWSVGWKAVSATQHRGNRAKSENSTMARFRAKRPI